MNNSPKDPKKEECCARCEESQSFRDCDDCSCHTIPKKEELSQCCNAKREVVNGEEGTSYWVCSKCKEEFIATSNCCEHCNSILHECIFPTCYCHTEPKKEDCCEKCFYDIHPIMGARCIFDFKDCPCHAAPQEEEKIVIEAITVKDGKLYICVDLDYIPEECEIMSKKQVDRIRDEATAKEAERWMHQTGNEHDKRIRQDTINSIKEKVGKKREKYGWIPLGKGEDPWNSAIDALLTLLNTEI